MEKYITINLCDGIKAFEQFKNNNLYHEIIRQFEFIKSDIDQFEYSTGTKIISITLSAELNKNDSFFYTTPFAIQFRDGKKKEFDELVLINDHKFEKIIEILNHSPNETLRKQFLTYNVKKYSAKKATDTFFITKIFDFEDACLQYRNKIIYADYNGIDTKNNESNSKAFGGWVQKLFAWCLPDEVKEDQYFKKYPVSSFEIDFSWKEGSMEKKRKQLRNSWNNVSRSDEKVGQVTLFTSFHKSPIKGKICKMLGEWLKKEHDKDFNWLVKYYLWTHIYTDNPTNPKQWEFKKTLENIQEIHKQYEAFINSND